MPIHIKPQPLPILNELPYGIVAAAYGLRNINKQVQRAIRVRDDTNTETDIGFIGENLDTAGMLNWSQRNLVADIPLGVDENEDGISDGWTKPNVIDATVNFSCGSFGQRIDMTNATNGISSNGIQKQIPCVVDNVLTISANCNFVLTNGSSYGYVRLRFYNSSNTQLQDSGVNPAASAKITATGNKIITISGTAPATTSYAIIQFFVHNGSIGANAKLDLQDASVTISNQSLYVAKWYDQSGNGNHATQTTAANQPRIVDAGVVDVDAAGRPRIYFDGSNDQLYKDGLSIPNIFSVSYVGSTAQVAASKRLVSLTSNTPANNTMITPSFNSSGQYDFGERFPNTYVTNLNAPADYATKSAIISYERTSTTNQVAYINGSNKDVEAETTVNFDITRIYLGGDTASGESYLQEYIVFRNPLSEAQRRKLERSQSRYYNIAVA